MRNDSDYVKQCKRVAKAMSRYTKKPVEFRLSPEQAQLLELDIRYVAHPKNIEGGAPITAQELARLVRADKNKYEWPANTVFNYKLSPVPDLSQGLRVLGFDPGTANFGCFAGHVVERKGLLEVTSFESSLLINPLTVVGNFQEGDVDRYVNEMRSFIETYEPHMITIERFMTRGINGATIELVSMMIGMLSLLVKEYEAKRGQRIQLNIIPAAVWKNQVNRVYSLDDVYSDARAHGIPDHKVDSCLMSLYLLVPGKNPYEFLADKKAYSLFLQQFLHINGIP